MAKRCAAVRYRRAFFSNDGGASDALLKAVSVGRSKHWIKVKNRKHPAMQSVKQSLCHLLATVENAIVASKPQESRPKPPTIRLVTGDVSMRCRMLRIDEDTFTMISGLIVIAVICIAGLLALGA
jgi:hypothetical protein